MSNLTRYNPFDEMFNEFSKGFWVKPLAFPAETELNLRSNCAGSIPMARRAGT